MNITSAAMVAAAIGLLAPAATAATLPEVTLSGVAREWVSAGPSNAYGMGIATSPGSTQVLWGEAPAGGSQSGYKFAGVKTPTNVAPATEFDLGVFTHLNNPIYTKPSDGSTTAITEAQLRLDFSIMIGDRDYLLSKLFTFEHDETPNKGGRGGACAYGGTTGTGPDANGCRDRVAIGDSLRVSEQIIVGGFAYTFNLEGFRVGDDMADFFLTNEQASNQANLFGSYTAEKLTPVPLPAAGWMLLAGVGGLVAMKRRKAKSQS